jgi:hypothetical protein
LLDVAQDLMRNGNLLEEGTARPTLGRTAIAAACSAAMNLAIRVIDHLGADAAASVLATTLAELVARPGEPSLDDASAALAAVLKRTRTVSLADVTAAARSEVARALTQAGA